MEEKASRGKMRRMNKEEFAYNKHLLREINDKRKASNYDGASRADEEEEAIEESESDGTQRIFRECIGSS